MQTWHLTSLVAAWLLFSACEEVIDLDIPEEPPRLVVNFAYGLSGELKLSQSKSVLDDTKVRPVSGATISLYDEKGCLGRFEESDSPGIYRPPCCVREGKTYTLHAEKEGFEPIEATATIPFPVEIQGVSYDTTHILPNEDTLNRDIIRANVRLHLDDPNQERNYYAVMIRKREDRNRSNEEGSRTNNLLYTLSSVPLNSKDPAIVSSNSQLIQNDGRIYGRVLIFDDHLFDGTSYAVRLSSDIYFRENSIDRGLEVRLFSISEHHFRYIQAQQFQQYQGENPLAEPIRVPNNIENGFGIFAGYSRDWFDVHFD